MTEDTQEQVINEVQEAIKAVCRRHRPSYCDATDCGSKACWHWEAGSHASYILGNDVPSKDE